MKIKFIGTGNMLTSDRSNTSILINNILFDIGSGTMRQLEILNIDFNNINYIVLSHFHADHFLDIAYFLLKRRLTQNTLHSLTIISPPNGRQKIIDLLNFVHGDGNPEKYNLIEEKFNIKIIELQNSNIFIAPDFSLTAYELNHGNCKPIYGYLLEYENHKLAYCTDTVNCENYKKLCNLSEYIFSDCNELESLPMHIGAYELLEIAKNHPSKTFFAIHRGNFENLESDNIIFPKDGDEFTISS